MAQGRRAQGKGARALGPRTARTVLLGAAGAFVASVLPGVRPPGVDYVPALDLLLSNAVMLASAVLCWRRARQPGPERTAWALMSAAVLVYLSGNVYYYLALADLPADQVPYPSLADAGWLGWYPLLAVALVLLVRARLAGVRGVLWLDGLTAGAGAAAVAGAVLLRPLLESTGGEPLLVVTNLAYPVADLALLTVVTVVFHLNGWRPDRAWWWIAVAAVLLMCGDTVYMVELAAGTYEDGGPVDASWVLVCTFLGMASLSPAPARRESGSGRVALAVPAAASLAGTAVLFAGSTSTGRLPVVVCLLGLLSVLLASARLLLTVRETQRLAEARREARTDELTGLPNRRELLDRLGRSLEDVRRGGGRCAVLLVDLDRFKEVNDTLGHHHGDQLLRAVAQRLDGMFRESDTVARLGGDEFAVLLPDVADLASAQELARRCIDALEGDFVIDGLTLHVEASVGLALAPLHAEDANGLMRAADVAMYEAKGRQAGVVVYDSGSDDHTPHRLTLLGDLRRAIQGDELVMHYQPKVDLARGAVAGVEALVRWHHPVRGVVPPAQFVPVAETTGLVMPLTLRTLRLAVADARRWWGDGRELQVAVNLSPRCLLDADLPRHVAEILRENGLPPRLLRLEVTESSLVVDPAGALTTLSELHRLGVLLSIDDFGTGYSSLSHLRRMPVDELKIDRSFVTDMVASAGDAVLVRSSVELGHNLGMSVVAEGVEDAATLAALADLDCDVAQGYHLGRPMDAEALSAWLAARAAGPTADPASVGAAP